MVELMREVIFDLIFVDGYRILLSFLSYHMGRGRIEMFRGVLHVNLYI